MIKKPKHTVMIQNGCLEMIRTMFNGRAEALMYQSRKLNGWGDLLNENCTKSEIHDKRLVNF